MEKKIQHLFTFQQPREVVWDYLTKPELLEQWLMPNNFKAVVGHKFQFTARAQPRFGFDGNIYCEVLEIVPLKTLSYSWRGGNGAEKVSLDSIVTWTLTEKASETELLLVHSGFKGMRNFIAYLVMNKGWQKIGKRLSKQLNIETHGHTTA